MSPVGLGIKNRYADKGQQQFNELDWNALIYICNKIEYLFITRTYIL